MLMNAYNMQTNIIASCEAAEIQFIYTLITFCYYLFIPINIFSLYDMILILEQFPHCGFNNLTI